MKRLSLLLALLAACDSEPDPEEGTKTEARTPDARKTEPLPPTGAPSYREAYATWVELVEEYEQRTENAADGTRKPKVSQVDNAVTACERFILALEGAVKNEARQTALHSYEIMAQRFAKRREALTTVYDEIAQLQEIVDEIRKGTRPEPAGHTLAELEDDLASERERAREMEKQLDELKAEMAQRENLLNSGDPIPPNEEALLYRQLQAFKKLKERAEALRDRLEAEKAPPGR